MIAGLALALLLTQWPTPTPSPEDRLVAEINQARVGQHKLPMWAYDPCVDRLSEAWGARIATTGTFEHRDQGAVITTCDASWAGEALIRGYDLTPEAIVRAWLDSPAHREIVLNPKAERVGVSITQDQLGRTTVVLNVVRD